MSARVLVGRTLAALGVLVIVVELLLYWLAPYLLGTAHALTAAPVALGCLFGFVGFYMLDHAETIAGAKVLVTSAVQLADAIPRPGFLKPGGRRANDPPVVAAPDVAGVAVPTTSAPPRGLTPDPVVTEEGD